MCPIVSKEADPPRMVSELIHTQETRWDSKIIGQVFLPYDVMAILQIPVCTRNVEDF